MQKLNSSSNICLKSNCKSVPTVSVEGRVWHGSGSHHTVQALVCVADIEFGKIEVLKARVKPEDLTIVENPPWLVREQKREVEQNTVRGERS